MRGLAVRLDHEVRPEAAAGQDAGRRASSRDSPQEGVELANAERRVAVRRPAIEEAAQESAHLRGPHVVLGRVIRSRGRLVLRLRRQQPEAQDALLDEEVEHRVRAEVERLPIDHQQRAHLDPVPPEDVDAAPHVGEGRSTGAVAALRVVDEGRPVQADADPEPVVPQEAPPVVVEQGGIGLQRVGDRLARSPQARLRVYRLREERPSQQRRLAAMPDEVDAVVQRVLERPGGHGEHDRVAHGLAAADAPIVAVRAAQVAVAGRLDDQGGVHALRSPPGPGPRPSRAPPSPLR